MQIFNPSILKITPLMSFVLLSLSITSNLNDYRNSTNNSRAENISQLSVITVTTTEDELNNNGKCSLREAVQASNSDMAVDSCPAGQGDDTIQLTSAVYTLSLGGNSEDENTEGDLDITGALTITGTGAEATVIQSGLNTDNAIDRILHVLNASTLTIRNVHIRYGRASSGATPHIDGGAIYVAATGMLNVYSSIVSYNWGANGGGITSAENTIVIIENSTFSNNESISGGGALNSNGVVRIRNTTFRENIGFFGGAIISSGKSIVVINSTLSGNRAVKSDWFPGESGYGGAIYNTGNLTLNNVTIFDNSATKGGGIFNATGIVTTSNSIIAMNISNDCSGSIISSNYNLDSDNSCNLTQTRDIPNSDPKLDKLEDNGGPTWTHALLVDSPAIDAGNPLKPGSGETSCQDIDQRGISRPKYDVCDIGAYEDDSLRYKDFLPLNIR